MYLIFFEVIPQSYIHTFTLSVGLQKKEIINISQWATKLKDFLLMGLLCQFINLYTF